MPKKFSFRLEPLLKIKAFKAQEAKQDLMQVVNLRLVKEQKIDERNNYLDTLFKKRRGRAAVSELQAEYYHKDYVKSEINKLEQERTQLLEIEQLKRQKLVEAMKEEKTLDKLKEKKKETYMQEIDKDEMAQLDEIARRKFFSQEPELI
jgi:flagellar protein FliJ